MSALQTMRLLAQIELHAGNWRTAREIGRAAIEQVELLGYEYHRPVMLGALAAIDACEGELERARALGTKSPADAHRIRRPPVVDLRPSHTALHRAVRRQRPGGTRPRRGDRRPLPGRTRVLVVVPPGRRDRGARARR